MLYLRPGDLPPTRESVATILARSQVVLVRPETIPGRIGWVFKTPTRAAVYWLRHDPSSDRPGYALTVVTLADGITYRREFPTGNYATQISTLSRLVREHGHDRPTPEPQENRQ